MVLSYVVKSLAAVVLAASQPSLSDQVFYDLESAAFSWAQESNQAYGGECVACHVTLPYLEAVQARGSRPSDVFLEHVLGIQSSWDNNTASGLVEQMGEEPFYHITYLRAAQLLGQEETALYDSELENVLAYQDETGGWPWVELERPPPYGVKDYAAILMLSILDSPESKEATLNSINQDEVSSQLWLCQTSLDYCNYDLLDYLFESQNPDGGWSTQSLYGFEVSSPSDGYGTGQALLYFCSLNVNTNAIDDALGWIRGELKKRERIRTPSLDPSSTRHFSNHIGEGVLARALHCLER